MQSPARQKDGVAGFNRNLMSITLCFSQFEGLDESAARRTLFQSGKNLSFRRGVGDVPELGFGFTAKFLSDRWRRMHLQRKIFLSVEQFCQDRKTRRVRDVAKNLLTMFTPKGM